MRIRNIAAILAAVAATAAVSTVRASDSTWNGNTSTAWSDPTNWSSGVPSASDKATIIHTAVRYPIVNGGTTTITGLAMDAGTSLTLQGGATFTINWAATKTISLGGSILASGGGTRVGLGDGLKDWTNSGVIDFSGGANFAASDAYFGLTDRLLTNTGGTISASSEDTRIYIPFSKVLGGTVDGIWRPQSTLKYNYGNALTFENVTLGSSFQAVSTGTTTGGVVDQASFTLRNSVTNNSVANDGAGWTYPAYGTMRLAVSSGNTFTFAGTGTLSLQGQSLGGTGITTIANTGSHTLGGYGTLNVTNLSNAGTIRASGGTAGTPRTLNATTITNTGGVVVDEYSTLNVGTLTSAAGSTVTMNGGTLSATTFNLDGDLSGHGTIGNVNNGGSITASGGTALAGKTLNTGTISGAGTVTVDQYNTLQSTGTVTASAVTVYGALHTGGSNWTVDTLDSSGLVHVDPGQSLTANIDVTTEAGSVLNVDGSLTAPAVEMAGMLTGSGTVHAAVSLTGTISPGNSPGTITLDGLSISDGAQYDFEEGDLIAVTGELNFEPGAKLTINVTPGLPYGPYTLMTADSISGTPRFMLDGVEVATFQQGDAILGVIPEPAILSLIGGASLLTLVRRRTR